MATSYDGQDLSATTAVSFASKSYYFIAIDDGKMALPTTAGQRVHGINQDNAASGLVGLYRAFGSSKLTLGATVAAGELVMSDANGKGMVATDGGGCAVALSSGVSGNVIQVLLIPALSGAGYLGAGTHMVTHYVDSMVAYSADGDIASAFTPGFSGKIKKTWWVQNVPVTTGSRAATVYWKIGSTATTGGVITLTSALCTPRGAVIAGSAITAANAFTATDTLTPYFDISAAFSEGSGTLYTVFGP